MIGTVLGAKTQALDLIFEDIDRLGFPLIIDTGSPDGDPGKFQIDGKVARAIHRFDGFHVQINSAWFDGKFEQPEVNNGHFYWYVFALASSRSKTAQSYFVCPYKKIIEFVLDFSNPGGPDYRDQTTWNGRIFPENDDYTLGYFAWRSEPRERRKPSRYINLRNIFEVVQPDISDSTISFELAEQRGSYAGLPSTERDAIVKSRIGQGQFRDDLEDYWEGCAVTGVNRSEILVASHIKPWRKSSNFERLDKYNGLLLSPDLDKLFDRGLISFKDNGKMLISSELTVTELSKLGISTSMRLRKVSEKHKKYLNFHRAHEFK